MMYLYVFSAIARHRSLNTNSCTFSQTISKSGFSFSLTESQKIPQNHTTQKEVGSGFKSPRPRPLLQQIVRERESWKNKEKQKKSKVCAHAIVQDKEDEKEKNATCSARKSTSAVLEVEWNKKEKKLIRPDERACVWPVSGAITEANEERNNGNNVKKFVNRISTNPRAVFRWRGKRKISIIRFPKRSIARTEWRPRQKRKFCASPHPHVYDLRPTLSGRTVHAPVN
jgi:hypothetical protein